MLDLTARCDCGAVTLTANGRAISMFQCACDNCQRVSGSGHSSVVLLPADAISVPVRIRASSERGNRRTIT